MTKLNFQKDLSINLDDLHTEFKNHAQLRYDYASELSMLEQKVRKAEEKVKVTRSKLTKKIFQEHEEKKLKAPTAAIIESYYRTHKDHKKAKEDLIQSKYDLSMAWNAVKAFDDRKCAIESEIKLYLNNYFSTPRTERSIEGENFKKEIKKISEETLEKTQNKQRKSLKRRRRN